MRVAAVAVLAVLVLGVGGYAVATGLLGAREPAPWLTAGPVAHRGAWTPAPGRPENSLAAFDAAAVNGVAIELDVQSSKDGKTVVIHDEELAKTTGAPGLVSDRTLSELKQLRLLGGEETIPTLEEVLALIDGRVPVFVEIKNENEVGPLEDDVAHQLSEYDGEAAVMSFNPFSLARVAQTAPSVLRGQLSSHFDGEDLEWYEKFLLRNLLMNWKSRPDFIAYDIKELPSAVVTVQRWFGRPVLGWTAQTPEEAEAARPLVDAVIADPQALPVDE